MLVKQLSEGTKEHTLTAFWEYLIYGELIYQIFEDDYKRSYGRDQSVTERLDQLREHYESILEGREGDFSERMMNLLEDVTRRFKAIYGAEAQDQFLTTEQVTDLIYKTNVSDIQTLTLDYLSHKERTLVLIDNIDKGWGAYGVDTDDVMVVRTLLEALRKISRQASRREVEFDWLVFLRNDVFELLVDDQSDRGKEDKIVVDWDSPAALREVIERRISVSTRGPNNRGATWADLATQSIDNEDSLDWLLKRSLMRPRYIIQLVNECIGHALTSGHPKITESDLKHGYRLYSLDIVGNTNFELRDVYPAAYDAIYCLIGSPRKTTIGNIRKLLTDFGYDDGDIPEIIRLFFWYGVLGAQSKNGEEKYIYDYRYDEKIFSRVRQITEGEEEEVFINLAFSAGLDCVQ
ncbi:MAG: hypothetical protein CMM61_17090 [Rhodospirillaceae bacterium]|nr:hypothetical protein [Rhodospirillaceae bacterium]